MSHTRELLKEAAVISVRDLMVKVVDANAYSVDDAILDVLHIKDIKKIYLLVDEKDAIFLADGKDTIKDRILFYHTIYESLTNGDVKNDTGSVVDRYIFEVCFVFPTDLIWGSHTLSDQDLFTYHHTKKPLSIDSKDAISTFLECADAKTLGEKHPCYLGATFDRLCSDYVLDDSDRTKSRIVTSKYISESTNTDAKKNASSHSLITNQLPPIMAIICLAEKYYAACQFLLIELARKLKLDMMVLMSLLVAKEQNIEKLHFVSKTVEQNDWVAKITPCLSTIKPNFLVNLHISEAEAVLPNNSKELGLNLTRISTVLDLSAIALLSNHAGSAASTSHLLEVTSPDSAANTPRQPEVTSSDSNASSVANTPRPTSWCSCHCLFCACGSTEEEDNSFMELPGNEPGSNKPNVPTALRS